MTHGADCHPVWLSSLTETQFEENQRCPTLTENDSNLDC